MGISSESLRIVVRGKLSYRSGLGRSVDASGVSAKRLTFTIAGSQKWRDEGAALSS